MVPGWVQIAVVILLAVLLFGGRGKISSIMGDFAKGIKSFKRGMKEEDETQSESQSSSPRVEGKKDEPIDVTPENKKV